MRQLIFYQTAVQTFKIINSGKPLYYFKQRITTTNPHGAVFGGEKKNRLVAVQVYNSLPTDMRNELRMSSAKLSKA